MSAQVHSTYNSVEKVSNQQSDDLDYSPTEAEKQLLRELRKKEQMKRYLAPEGEDLVSLYPKSKV